MNDSSMPQSGQKAQIELDLFSAIERGEVVTQMALKARVGVSVGLVNALVKRAIAKGYAKVSQAPYRRYAYYLTPTGFTEKSRLVAEYLEASLHFFREARGQYSALFARAKACGNSRVALAGRGELVEIALLAALSEGVEVIGIISPDAAGATWLGVSVVENVTDLDAVDIVVLCEKKVPQATYEELCTGWVSSKVVAPPLLRITPNREELLSRIRKGERA